MSTWDSCHSFQLIQLATQVLRGTIKRACKNTLELWTTEKKEDLFTNSGLKDYLADCSTLPVVKRLHSLPIAGVVPPNYKSNNVGLVRNSAGLKVQIEGLQRKL